MNPLNPYNFKSPNIQYLFHYYYPYLNIYPTPAPTDKDEREDMRVYLLVRLKLGLQRSFKKWLYDFKSLGF